MITMLSSVTSESSVVQALDLRGDYLDFAENQNSELCRRFGVIPKCS
jgi:hypothetical protein